MRNLTVDEKIQKFKHEGVENIHVLIDFDGTISQAFDRLGNKPGNSTSVLVRNPEILGEEFVKEFQALSEYYKPREHNPDIPTDVKVREMEEWYQKGYDVMKKYGYARKHQKYILENKLIPLREEFADFLQLIKKSKITITIFSAGQLRLIKQIFKKEKDLDSNIHIIANHLEFEHELRGGEFKGTVRDPIVHPFNKSVGQQVHRFEKKKKFLEKQNILLIGDSLHDLYMTLGFPSYDERSNDNVLSIGFCSRENVAKAKDLFDENFDIVLRDDASFEEINNIVRRLISK